MAASSGVTPPMLSAYENERTLPELETLEKILHAGLGVSVAELGRALDVVNDRAAQAEPMADRASSARGNAAATPQPLEVTLRSLLSLDGAPLPPALEEGFAHLLRGLLLLSRYALETAAKGRLDGAAE